MEYPGNKINIVLVGQSIESHLVFNNALSSLGMDISLKYFFELPKAIQYLEHFADHKPDMLFLEPGKNDDCLASIRQIRELHRFDDLSVVLYDSGMQSLDCEEAFAKGTNVYIHRKQDFAGLKKILRHLIGINHQFHAGNMNRETYMVSL